MLYIRSTFWPGQRLNHFMEVLYCVCHSRLHLEVSLIVTPRQKSNSRFSYLSYAWSSLNGIQLIGRIAIADGEGGQPLKMIVSGPPLRD